VTTAHENANLAKRDLLANEVNVDLDVLRTSMVDWIGGHIDRTNVVAVDHRGRGNGEVKFL
jgi:hypothetical protein